jgi:hypothetical protein
MIHRDAILAELLEIESLVHATVSEVKRTSRLGVQVVRINADLLHFHSTRLHRKEALEAST